MLASAYFVCSEFDCYSPGIKCARQQLQQQKPLLTNATSVVAHAQRGRTHNLTCCLVCGVSRQFVVIRACAARSLTLCHAHTHTHTDGAYVVLFTFWVYLIVDSLSNSIFITHSGVAVAQSHCKWSSLGAATVVWHM